MREPVQDALAKAHFVDDPLVLPSPERQALIEAQKALVCAQKMINKVLGRT